MIPLVIPPLSNLGVLVTRPAQQAGELCAAINKLGGEAIPFPVLDIQPRAHILMQSSYDLVIFISANAALHGMSLLQQLGAPQIAAIGNATTATLQSVGVDVGITAPAPFNTEALLSHEKLQSPPKDILIIRGVGGREILREVLVTRGSQVHVAEVYERVTASIALDARDELLRRLRNAEIDAVTVTSIDIVQALMSILGPEEQQWLSGCTAVAGSERIAEQLPTLGWQGECIVSDSPDDMTLLETMIRWHTRSRN